MSPTGERFGEGYVRGEKDWKREERGQAKVINCSKGHRGEDEKKRKTQEDTRGEDEKCSIYRREEDTRGYKR